MNRKLDLLNLKVSMKAKDGTMIELLSWSNVDIVGEQKKGKYSLGEFMKEVHIPMCSKVLCIYKGQPGH